MRLIGAFAAAMLAAACASGSAPEPSPRRIEADIRFLADDLLEGRDTGSRGYDIAARYVAERFRGLGLEPMGNDGGYMQRVPLRTYRRAPGGRVTLQRDDGSVIEGALDETYLVDAHPAQEEATIRAPVIFVGHGVAAPGHGFDEYEGLDVEGAIVATLPGAPARLNTEARAHFRNAKSAIASSRGAVGHLALFTPSEDRRFGFQRRVARAAFPRMAWRDQAGLPNLRAPNLQATATLNLATSEALFIGAERSWADILDAFESGDHAQGFPLPLTAEIRSASIHEDIESMNVVGFLEGADPALRDEVVVLTAHLDHIGVGAAIGDDAINNGALDNAAGIATMLEVARLVVEAESRPRRSLMFVALTAEEKGLVGADFFVHHPPAPIARIVANVNLDMPVLTYDFVDLVAFGAERSSLGPTVAKAAAAFGASLAPDPFPNQGLFTRSDHYRFVQKGVPAVFLSTGFGGEGEAAWGRHFGSVYHRPTDEVNETLNFVAAARFAAVNHAIALEIANADARPLWNKGDFFGVLFDGPMAEE